jgi:NTP pyrophosphatase (non-canonical NTP hydrolase)
MDNFIEDCKRTESVLNGVMLSAGSARLVHAAFGMSTEAGEFLDQLKKHFFYGKALDLTNLKEELGDILWYIAIAMDELGTDFPTEMDRVIRKLRVRFPEKFNPVDANLRDLNAERDELERG